MIGPLQWTALAHAPKTTLMNEELDATGLLCPLPVLKARKRLLGLTTGTELWVLTDDPAAIVDMPHFCAEAGHTLVSSETSGDAMLWVIRKA
jgi:tRNA 2-thiouridine synthesizing protein A